MLVSASVAGALPFHLMRVGSDSMAPALTAGDLVVVARGQEVARRDVVVIRDPSGSGLLVKRAVAVGGDSVAIEDGVLVVNGAEVCETTIDPALIDGVWFGPVRVPEDGVFVLGDERDGSVDSRVYGPLAVSDVLGHVTVRAWPSPGSLGPATC